MGNSRLRLGILLALLSRTQTRWLNYNVAAAGGIYGGGGIALCAGLAAISTAGAAFVAVGCGVVIAVYGGFIQNALSHAASDNGCLRMRYGALGYASMTTTVASAARPEGV